MGSPDHAGPTRHFDLMEISLAVFFLLHSCHCAPYTQQKNNIWPKIVCPRPSLNWPYFCTLTKNGALLLLYASDASRRWPFEAAMTFAPYPSSSHVNMLTARLHPWLFFHYVNGVLVLTFTLQKTSSLSVVCVFFKLSTWITPVRIDWQTDGYIRPEGGELMPAEWWTQLCVCVCSCVCVTLDVHMHRR